MQSNPTKKQLTRHASFRQPSSPDAKGFPSAEGHFLHPHYLRSNSARFDNAGGGNFLTPYEGGGPGRKQRANSIGVIRADNDAVFASDHLGGGAPEVSGVPRQFKQRLPSSAENLPPLLDENEEEIGPIARERRHSSLKRSLTPPPHGSMMRRQYSDQYYYHPAHDRRFSEFAAPAHFLPETDEQAFSRAATSRRPIMSARVHHSSRVPYDYGPPVDDEGPDIDDIPPYRPPRDPNYDQCPKDLAFPPRRPRRKLPPVPPASARCEEGARLNAVAVGAPPRQLPVPEIQILPDSPMTPPQRRIDTQPPDAPRNYVPSSKSTMYSRLDDPPPQILEDEEQDLPTTSWRAQRLGPDFSDIIRQESIDSMDRNSTPECITPPPRNVTPRVSAPGYQPARHALKGSQVRSQNSCRRRPSLQTNRNYVETECTCPAPDVAESSSAENLECKSSENDENSDVETAGSATPNETFQNVETDSGLSESIPDFKSPSDGSVASSAGSAHAQPKDTLFASKPPEIDTYLESGIGMGILKFSVQYFPLRRRLRIQTRKSEDLAGGLLEGKPFNSYLRVYLMPGKIQKQLSRSIRNNRSPVFNEEFFFDNINPDEVGEKILMIDVCYDDLKSSESSKVKEDEFGKISVALRALNGLLTKKEIHCTRSFKPKTDFKKLGKLQIYTCLEKDAKRFTVNVIKADDLPKFPLIGTPDPFVKIDVEQNGHLQSKQTRTLKNTTSPTWKEAVMFLVEVSKASLDATKIIIGVHDANRANACSDVIGVVILGTGAREKGEIDQWKHLLSGGGKDIKATHHLRPLDEACEP